MPISEHSNRTFLLFLTLLFSISSPAQPDTLLLQALEEKARKLYSKNLDSSLYYARQILLLDESNKTPSSRAFALNWIGICYMLKGKPDSAEHYYFKTIAYCQEHDQPGYLQKAHLNLSINYYQQGLFEEALQTAQAALRSFEEKGDDLGVAHARYNIGNCLFQLGRPDEARSFYRAALSTYLHTDNTLSISNTYNAIGSVFQEQQKYDSALYYFYKSVGNKKSVGGENFCAAEYINIGNTYREIEQTDSAVFYLHKAFNAAGHRGDRQKVATACLDLAHLYKGISQPDSALYYGNMANTLSLQIGDNYLLKESLYELASVNAQRADYAKAYEQLSEYLRLQDSLSGVALEEKAIALEKRYRLAEKDKQILQQKLAYQEKEAALRQQIYLSLLLALVLVVVTILFYYFYKKQQLMHRAKMDRERRRIAMDLHDYVGAELTLVSSGLDTRIYKLENGRDKEMLSKLAEQVRNVNKVLRETVWSIREDDITVNQLLEKVQSFIEGFAENNELIVETHTNTGSIALPPQVALALYRICQEGCANSIKYAKAKKLSISISKKGKTLSLALRDDGIGFDPSGITRGYGLANMRQRAAQIGADLSIKSKPGQGTEISVVVSLEA